MSEEPKKEDIKYLLGKMCGSIEAIENDVSEIKNEMIPDGRHRMEKAEDKLEKLTVWKKVTTMLSILFVGAVGWLQAKINFIGGIFNG